MRDADRLKTEPQMGVCHVQTYGAIMTRVTTNGNRIEYHRGDGVTEWYVNDPRGLEQGFTILEEPRGESGRVALHRDRGREAGRAGARPYPDTSTLCMDLVVRGNLEPDMMPGGGIIEFVSPGGVGIIRYGQLAVHDGTGRELPTRMELIRQDEQDLQDAGNTNAFSFENRANPV